ncbi:unnamed protein product [Lampetra fluviatilis]
MPDKERVLPMVLWGLHAPNHCVSSLLLTEDQHTIVTGCQDGQLCLWNLDEDLKITPRALLFGHLEGVTCLGRANPLRDHPYVVSCDENGQMCLWDVSDGRCVEFRQHPYVHTEMHYYKCPYGSADEGWLLCSGCYSDVLILDALTLKVLGSLASKDAPNWMATISVLRCTRTLEDIVVGVSVAGLLKVWNLSNVLNNIQDSEPVFEKESMAVDGLDAQAVAFCTYTQSTLLLVCSHIWKVLSLENFCARCCMPRTADGPWTGGDFLAANKVLVWTSRGQGYIYKLPDSPKQMTDCSSLNHEAPLLLYILEDTLPEPRASLQVLRYAEGRTEPFHKLLLRGDSAGRVGTWLIPDVLVPKHDGSVQKLPVTSSGSLRQAFEGTASDAAAAETAWSAPGAEHAERTALVYAVPHGLLACGYSDGHILVYPAAAMALTHFLEGARDIGPECTLGLLCFPPTGCLDLPGHYTLQGHGGAVSCLLYPHEAARRYDSRWLISGAADFSVRLWDVLSQELLCAFHPHAGSVTQLLLPPDNCHETVLRCVCSVASDHSVALLSLTERRPLLLASRHAFPVQAVRWRAADDLLLVCCSDGSLYVWQMDSGVLDRCVVGLAAEEILSLCDDRDPAGGYVALEPGGPWGGLHKYPRLRSFKTLLAHRHAVQPPSLEVADKDLLSTPAKLLQAFTFQAVTPSVCDLAIHLIFFDMQALVSLLAIEEALPGKPSLPLKFEASAKPRKHSRLLKRGASETILHLCENFKLSGDKEERDDRAKQHQHSAEPLTKVDDQCKLMAEAHARLFMSCLHRWGLDPELDKLCTGRLGLLRPQMAVSFVLLSQCGHAMAVALPGWDLLEQRPLRTVGFRAGAEASRRRETGGGQGCTPLSVSTQRQLSVISLASTLVGMCTTNLYESVRTSRDGHGGENENGSPRIERTKNVGAKQESLKSDKEGGLNQANGSLPGLLASLHAQPVLMEKLIKHWEGDLLEWASGEAGPVQACDLASADRPARHTPAEARADHPHPAAQDGALMSPDVVPRRGSTDRTRQASPFRRNRHSLELGQTADILKVSKTRHAKKVSSCKAS